MAVRPVLGTPGYHHPTVARPYLPGLRERAPTRQQILPRSTLQSVHGPCLSRADDGHGRCARASGRQPEDHEPVQHAQGHRDGRARAPASRAHTRCNREQQVNRATTCVVVRHLFACVRGADGRSVMNRYPWRLLVVALVTVASVAVLATPPVAAYPAPAGRLAPVTSPGVYRPVQQRLGQPGAQPTPTPP